MKTPTYRRVSAKNLARAAAFCLLALAASLLHTREARAQFTTSGNNTTTTNNVGVGTAAPEQVLHVNGPSEILSTGSGSGFKFRNRGSATNADDWVWYSTDNVARFWRAGIGDLLGVTTTGNLGIGTNSPGRRLEVLAPDGDAARLYRNAANVGWGVNMVFALNNSNNVRTDYAGVHGILGSAAAGAEAGNLVFTTATGGALTEKMRINTTGNVGIGMTAPAFLLDVSGSAGSPFRVRDSSGREYLSTNARSGTFGTTAVVTLSGGRLIVDHDGPDGDNNTIIRRMVNHIIFNASDHPDLPGSFAVRHRGGTPAMVVEQKAGGNVGIGTWAPAFKFDVQGGAINATGGLCIAGDCKTAWSQVGGGSQWTTSGSSLLYNSGNVGIATQATASAKLVIGGVAGSEGLDLASADQYANLRVIRNSKSTFDKDLYLQYGAGAGSKIRFYTDNAESMTLAGGNLGIGTATPTAKLHVAGNITVDGNINAKYQDVAEWVPTKQKLSAGTVVVLDTRHSNHVAASAVAYDTRVAGVISAQPGISLGEAGEGKVLVATTGRVKVKVDATKAPIQIGDLIVTGEAEGVGMKSEPILLGGRQIHSPGTIIGKALEPLEKGTGEILVLLSLQ